MHMHTHMDTGKRKYTQKAKIQNRIYTENCNSEKKKTHKKNAQKTQTQRPHILKYNNKEYPGKCT